MKAALVQNFKANVNNISAIERCQMYRKILCLELRYWNSTRLDTNLDFLFSFGSNSVHCLWYRIYVVLHHLFIFKILYPKLCSGSWLWWACSSELDVPVQTFFVTQTERQLCSQYYFHESAWKQTVKTALLNVLCSIECHLLLLVLFLI